MKGKEYLQSIGFDESHLPELFNDDDKSYYKISELLDSFAIASKNHGVSHHVRICAYMAYIGDEEKVVLAENIADAMDKLEEVTDSTTDISVRPVSFEVIS